MRSPVANDSSRKFSKATDDEKAIELTESAKETLAWFYASR